jgi:MYXO-CTERM domain-containing protein
MDQVVLGATTEVGMRVRALTGTLVAGVIASLWQVPEAKACGGCFAPPPQPSQIATVITDHKMIFRVTPQATTLYDEIQYQGSPSDFAWVLPIQGQVTVGLSSDILFSSLDSATQTTIVAPPLPQCPVCPCSSSSGGAGFAVPGVDEAADGGAVTILSQAVVGPYETVQLQSPDPNALTNWLTTHGYDIPASIQPVIAAYVTEGFDFLALRLVPGVDVQAMRPVRVTSPGAGLSLPLRMVAAGTGATVGITLWVVGDGRYEPANFPSFTIDPSSITWDWSTNASNYTTLRTSEEALLKYSAWQIESSIDVAPYTIEGAVLNDVAENDYLAVPASDGGDDGGAGETAEQVRQDDLATLFPGGNQGIVRVTRIRGDLSHAALATDLTLTASPNDAVLSNIYQVTQSANAPACPSCPSCGESCPGVYSCNDTTSSSGVSSGTSSSGGTSGGGSSSGGCATVGTEQPRGASTDLALVALAGLAFIGLRARRRG